MSIHKRTDVGRKGKPHQVKWDDENGRQRSASFRTEKEAKLFQAEVITSKARGTYINPDTAKITVAEWAETWMSGYARRYGSRKSARTHLNHIVGGSLGPMTLASVRPSHINAWTASLAAPSERKPTGYAQSFIAATYRRFNQIMTAAVDDGILIKNPCNRGTAQKGGKKVCYVATTEQVWQLYFAMPEDLRAAVLLGAFAGLRIGEVSGLRPEDVDPLDLSLMPTIQWPTDPGDPDSTDLKTPGSHRPVEIPADLAGELLAAALAGDGSTLLRNQWGDPATPKCIQRHFDVARLVVPGLPVKSTGKPAFRFHDLRHYFASALIADPEMNILEVAARMRNTPNETLRTYGHLLPRQDRSRAAMEKRMAVREQIQ